MPPTRRLKTALLLAVLATLTILYITQGPSNTYSSPFYTRTVAAIQTRHDTEARDAVIAEEKTRADRVARIQEEHEKAMGETKQKPMADDAPAAAPTVKAQEAPAADSKPVAGRKMIPSEGNSNSNNGGKVVVNPNAEDDGVARVGNTGASKSRESSAAKKQSKSEEEETASEHEIEVEMNSILKKGPIIIFSKSYCPYSKKAKVRPTLATPSKPAPVLTFSLPQHILLSSYTITPPPYVVELDLHPLGPGLQAALEKSTGRRTVPNVLINGKSIGGGDDVAALDESDKLTSKIKEMGGKRIMEVKKVEVKEGEGLGAAAGKREVKFKG
jgi:glutaredoxin